MSWKLDVAKSIAELASKLDTMLANNQPTDGDEPFAPNEVISKRAKIQAIRSASDLFKDSDSIVPGTDELQMMYKYQLPAKYQQEYYFRAISPNGFGYFAINSNIITNDVKLSSKCLYAFITWAVMFDGMALQLKDDKLLPCYINQDGTKISDFWLTKDNLKKVIKENGTINEKELNMKPIGDTKVFPLSLFWDGIGLWVKCIPDLGREIYYEWGRDDVAGQLNIIPTFASLYPGIKSSVNEVIYNKAEHKAVHQGDKTTLSVKTDTSVGEKMWMTPPAEANTLYDTLTKNLDYIKQMWRHKHGIAYGNVNATSNNDSFQDVYKTAFMFIMRPLYEYFKEVKTQLNLNIDVPDLNTTLIKEEDNVPKFGDAKESNESGDKII